MILLLAIICVGLAALSGLYQGPIRGLFSVAGVLLGSLLAVPLSPLGRLPLMLFGFNDPFWQWLLSLVLAFVAVWLAVRAAGSAVHRQVYLKFKYRYRNNEDRYLRWERLYSRLGFCLGAFNGAVYFFVLCVPIYVAGHWTLQVDAGPEASTPVRMINRLATGLHRSDLDRVVAAFDPMPASVYRAGDVAALVLRNPDARQRLAKYPPCLALATQPEIHDLLSDPDLNQMLKENPSVRDVLRHPKVHAVLTNQTLVAQIERTLGADLSDLNGFLLTGKSPKFDVSRILGSWSIDPEASAGEIRTQYPAILPLQMRATRDALVPAILGLSLRATPDNRVVLSKPSAETGESTTVAEGEWQQTDAGLALKFNLPKPETAVVRFDGNDSVVFLYEGHNLCFDRSN